MSTGNPWEPFKHGMLNFDSCPYAGFASVDSAGRATGRFARCLVSLEVDLGWLGVFAPCQVWPKLPVCGSFGTWAAHEFSQEQPGRLTDCLLSFRGKILLEARGSCDAAHAPV